jgi:hypothetical protein
MSGLGTPPCRCLHHSRPQSPQWTRQNSGHEYLFHGGLDAAKDLLRQPLELNDPHQCHQYSCSEMAAVKHSCRPSTQNRAQYNSFNNRLGSSREIEGIDYLGKSTEHSMGRDSVWRLTQYVTGLVCELSKLCSLCNISQY